MDPESLEEDWFEDVRLSHETQVVGVRCIRCSLRVVPQQVVAGDIKQV